MWFSEEACRCFRPRARYQHTRERRHGKGPAEVLALCIIVAVKPVTASAAARGRLLLPACGRPAAHGHPPRASLLIGLPMFAASAPNAQPCMTANPVSPESAKAAHVGAADKPRYIIMYN